MNVEGKFLLQGIYIMLCVAWSNAVADTVIFRGITARRISTKLFYIRSTTGAGIAAQISDTLLGRSFVECCSECMANKKCAGVLHHEQSCHLLNSIAGIREQEDGNGSVKGVLIGTYPDTEVRAEACEGTPQVNSDVYPVPYVPPVQQYDCLGWYKRGYTWDGLYCVNPAGTGSFWSYCDMSRDGGGWTVIQRRVDGSVDFYREWSAYAAGFGDLEGNVWLGLDRIHALTSVADTELHVSLETFNATSAWARYGFFRVGDSAADYVLTVSNYSGDAGDSLARHNGKPFTTYDKDNDNHSYNCAVTFHGAWWYDNCLNSSLNGLYYSENPTEFNQGLIWNGFTRKYYSNREVAMKIRGRN